MDKLDVRIIREILQGEPRSSIWPVRPTVKPRFSQLSRKLGVSENTIRDRQRKLSRFIAGWTLMLNPSIVGQRVGSLVLDVPSGSDKEGILEQLELVEDMVIIGSFHGSKIDANFYYRDEENLKKKIELIRRIARSEKSEFTEIPFPECRVRPTRTDFEIIASRQDNMSKPFSEVARELGRSSRTLRRRYALLTGSAVILTVASMKMEGLQEGVYAPLEVHCDENCRARCESQVYSMVENRLIFYGRFVKFSYFNLILPSITAARDILERVKALEGITSARVDFGDTRLEMYEVYKRQVVEKLAELGGSSP